MFPGVGIFDRSQWRNRLLQIHGSGVHEVQVSNDFQEGTRVRFELVGHAAEDFLNQLQGYPPVPTGLPPVPPVNHQDEALAAARRDAQHEKRRAEAAESLVQGLQDEIADYQGEIDALKEELVEAKERVVISIDPGSSGWARGGYVSGGGGGAAAVPGTSHHGQFGRSLSQQKEIMERMSKMYGWVPQIIPPEPAPSAPVLRGTMTHAEIERAMKQYEIDKYSLDGETL